MPNLSALIKTNCSPLTLNDSFEISASQISSISGAELTVKVKLCVALGFVPLDAVIVNVCVPTAVVPEIVIKPVALLMLTPAGWPVMPYVIGAVPVAVT